MNEKQRYWQQHLAAQQECGLEVKEYCARESLSYASFQYWHRKCHRKPAPPLIPVKIKSNSDASGIICTLVLRDGARIEFYDSDLVKAMLARCL